MNGDTELSPAPGTAPVVEPPLTHRIGKQVFPVLVDLWIVAVWFAVAGLVGAFLWEQLTPLAQFTRTADNGIMDEQQFAKQIATDGWFFLIAALGGVLSGGLLLAWRRRTPELMVLMVAGGGALATWLMTRVGLDLGPEDPSAALARAAVGDHVPLQLRLSAHGLYLVWSLAALVGGLVVLWGGEFLASRRRHAAELSQYRNSQPVPTWLPPETPRNG